MSFVIFVVFANGQGDLGSIPGQIIRKTQKMVPDSTFVSIQYYKVQIKDKVEQCRERSSALPYTLVYLLYLHVYECGFQIAHGIKQCTMCQCNNSIDITYHSKYLPFLELLQSCDICTANTYQNIAELLTCLSICTKAGRWGRRKNTGI